MNAVHAKWQKNYYHIIIMRVSAIGRCVQHISICGVFADHLCGYKVMAWAFDLNKTSHHVKSNSLKHLDAPRFSLVRPLIPKVSTETGIVYCYFRQRLIKISHMPVTPGHVLR
jgi:hypothetical protein